MTDIPVRKGQQEGKRVEPGFIEYGRCPRCGYLMLPVPPLSPCGHDQDPELAPLTEPGFVYSWTRAWSGGETSKIIAMADFFDGKLRVNAPVIGEEVQIGDTVHLTRGEGSPYVLRVVGR